MKGSKTKQKKRRKKKITQVLMKSKVKFVSAVVCLLTFFWIHLCFSLSSRSWVGLQLPATLPVSPSTASRRSFHCNPEGKVSVSPGRHCSVFWKNCGCISSFTYLLFLETSGTFFFLRNPIYFFLKQHVLLIVSISSFMGLHIFSDLSHCSITHSSRGSTPFALSSCNFSFLCGFQRDQIKQSNASVILQRQEIQENPQPRTNLYVNLWSFRVSNKV